MEENVVEVQQEEKHEAAEIQKKTIWDAKVIISFIVSAIFICVGFNKMLNYELGGDYGDGVNSYVGGDAYNYIINGNYTIAYFVLALLCSVVACTFLIVNVLQQGGAEK